MATYLDGLHVEVPWLHHATGITPQEKESGRISTHTRRSCQPAQFPLIYAARCLEGCRSCILNERFACDVHSELFQSFDVRSGIFEMRNAIGRNVLNSDGDDRWVGGDLVEPAIASQRTTSQARKQNRLREWYVPVRGKVRGTVFAESRNERDRAWRDRANHQLIQLSIINEYTVSIWIVSL